MNAETIRSELRAFLKANYLGVSADNVADGDSFLKKGLIDSIGVIELVTFVQKKYSVRVDAKDIVPDNFDTLAGVTAFILRKKEVRP